MSAAWILSAGVADGTGVAGTSGTLVRWCDRGLDPRARIPWRRVFDAPFPEFRRLDPLSRFCCLAVEAVAPADHLDRSTRERTALVLATTLGCLESDERFQRGLVASTIEPAVFPYTLPSTCLGDLAIRHGLMGPTLCLATGERDVEAAVCETARLLDSGEAAAALLCIGDVLFAPLPGVAPRSHMLAVLLRADATGSYTGLDVEALRDQLWKA
jgi:3-oxoacyl-(acyl-carrier-protein) synthase